MPWEETGYQGDAGVAGRYVQVEVDESGTIIALLDQGALVRTTDRGINWEIIEGLTIPNITGLEKYGSTFYLNSSTHGLFTSTDLKSWERILEGRSFYSINSEKGFLFARGVKSYYMSAPGEEFVAIPDSVSIGFSGIAKVGTDLYYLSQYGYWRSAMGSNSWSRLSDGLSNERTLIDFVIVKDSTYLATQESNGRPHLYASPADRVLPLGSLREMFIEGTYPFEAMYTTDDSVIVATRRSSDGIYSDIHYTRDRTRLSPPLQTPGDLKDLSIIDGKYYVVTEGGIYESTDFSLSWQKMSNRLEPNTVVQLLAIPDGRLFASTTHGEILTSVDKGDSWAVQRDLRQPATLLAYTPAGTLLVGVPGQLLASRNLGLSFVGSDEGFSRRTPQAFAVGKNDKLFLGTDSGMYYSTDDGATWFRPRDTNIFIVSPDRVQPQVFSIAIDPRNNGLYLGTNRGVLYSLNEGDKYESGWLARSPIYALAVNQYGEVFAGSLAINASDPNKRNFYRGWDVLNQQTAWISPDTTINDFDVDKLMLNSKGQIISGMLFSGTSGNSWIFSEIEGIGSPKRVDAQTIDKEDIAYVSVGEKVYRSAGPKLNVPRDPSSLASYTMRIYPNPAANAFQFESGVEGEFVIYNTLGQSVLSSALAGGARSIDISHLPNGNYICQVTTSEGVSRVSLAIVH